MSAGNLQLVRTVSRPLKKWI